MLKMMALLMQPARHFGSTGLPTFPFVANLLYHDLNLERVSVYAFSFQLVKLFMQQQHDEELLKKALEGIEMLDKFLEGRLWAAGDTLTIADFALVASVSTAEVCYINCNNAA
jgi:glutathione S-transferase